MTGMGALEYDAEVEQAVRRVAAGLRSRGISTPALARAAGVNQSSLLATLTQGTERTPSRQYVERLLRGVLLTALAEDTPLSEELALDADVRLIRERLLRSTSWTFTTPGQIIDRRSIEYVERASDRSLPRRLTGGAFIVSGPPQSGRSSLVHRFADDERQRGRTVVFITPGADLGPEIYRRLTGRRPPADVTELALIDEIEVACAGHDLIVVDGYTVAPDRPYMRSILGLAEHQMTQMTPQPTWLFVAGHASLDDSLNSPYGSLSQVRGTLYSNWFTEEEVHGLAGAIRPWIDRPLHHHDDGIVHEAIRLFAGQPLLSHAFLSDTMREGQEPDLTRPTGVYRDHLRRLARLICTRADAAESFLADTWEADGWRLDLSRIGVTSATGPADLSCELYELHLRDFVRDEVTAASRPATMVGPTESPVVRTPAPTGAGRKVFISYAVEDSERVHALCDAIEAAGIDTWVDTRELLPGDLWAEEIRHAISEGAAFVVCFSDATRSRTRTYVWKELDLAIEELALRGGRAGWFFPVELDEGTAPDIEVDSRRRLAHFQVARLYEGSDATARLVTALGRRLRPRS